MKYKHIYILLLLVGFVSTMQGQRCLNGYYYDQDGDGFGGQTAYTGTDTVTPGFAALNNLVCNSTDCDDTNAEINPNSSWVILVDADGDGSFVLSAVEHGCTPSNSNAILLGENSVLENFSHLQLDCDDTNASLSEAKLFYRDSDNDGKGDISDIILSCSGSMPTGYVENAGDWCPDTYGLYNGCPDVTDHQGITQTQNYVHSIGYQQPFELSELSNVTEKDKLEQVTYFDGMGRAELQIAIGQSPKDARDIRTIVTYDNYGRASASFLPYVSTTKGGGYHSNTVGGLTASTIDKEVKLQQQFYHNKYMEDVPSYSTANGGLAMLQSLENVPQDLLDNITSDIPETGLLYPSYSTQTFDEIDRVTQAAAPGKDWSLEQSHTIKMEYDLNEKDDDLVKRYHVTHPGSPENIQLNADDYYPTGELYKTVTKDENWQPNQPASKEKDHTSEEFTNKSGQVLLKRTYNEGQTHDTYYIYDDFGNLSYVLPPVASSQASVTTTVLDQWCYQYKYDHRNRLIEKKIPGKGWEYIIYDKLDRPVLTQDINLRATNKWLFTKYDAFGRVVYTGEYTDTSNSSRASLQNTVSSSATLHETKTTSSTQIGDTYVFYSNNVFPSTSVELLTINYYDNYLWNTENSFEANYRLNGNDGITTTGVTHQKEAGLPASWTNSGFDTEGSIKGDGYIQYTITQTDKRVMVGLTKAEGEVADDIHYNSIGYAIYTGYGTNKRVLAYKNGIIESFAPVYCEVGDTFRVERLGNQILYKKNGVAFHSVIVDTIETLVGDASLYDPGTAVENVYIGYSVMGQDFIQNVKGLATGSQSRVLGTNHWITSVSYYDDKGRVIHTTSRNRYLNTLDAVSNKLDFTGKVLKSRTTHQRGNDSPIVTVDNYEYDKVGRLLYQTKEINGGDKELMAKNHYDELGQLEKKQVGGSHPSLSTYTHQTNINVSGNIITKSTANGWDSGINTSNSITADGYVSFTPMVTSHYFMAGLTDDTSGASGYVHIDYSLYLFWGKVHVYESGVNKGLQESFLPGDSFKVERRGNNIYYSKNGETFYISDIPDPGNTLVGDVAIFTEDGQVKDVVLVDLEKELQEVDYTYNVRGWLKGINDVNNQGNDLFSFALNYNDSTDPTKRLFNGNISSTQWKTKGQDSSLKSYVYDYDALNRITEAIDNTGNYNLDEVEYDKNGNIKRLQRSGHRNTAATVFGVMDQLVYEYQGNQLQKVTDHVGIDFGFKDGNTVGNDYEYDLNGNMTKDKNKGINAITYNHLNLPKQISFDNGSTITYIYDATGVKQEKIVNDSSLSGDQRTYYAGNYIYNKGNSHGQSDVKLTFFNTEEGYVEPVYELTGGGQLTGGLQGNLPQVESLTGFDFVYQYKDHLGNIRLSYQDMDDDGNINPQTEIREENHYYPFGLQHKGYNNNIGAGRDHQYGYNGKEEQNELSLNWSDFGWRNYDASLGRWMNIDQLAEKYSKLSPYNYTMNNPIFFVDPDGRKIYNGDEIRRKKAAKNYASARRDLEAKAQYLGISVDASKKEWKKAAKAKGGKKEWRATKNALKFANSRKDILDKLTKRAKAAQERIDEFKEGSPEKYAIMDNIKNEYGEEVDIYVGMVSRQSRGENNGENVFSWYTTYDDNKKLKEVRMATMRNGGVVINSIDIYLAYSMTADKQSETPTTIETTRHEMGHANYNIQNSLSYYLYLKKLEKNNISSEGGHNVGNPSGERAEEWEKNK